MIRFISWVIMYCLSIGAYPCRRWIRNFSSKTNHLHWLKKNGCKASDCASSKLREKNVGAVLKLYQSDFILGECPSCFPRKISFKFFASTNIYLALLVVGAALSVTIRNFSASDSYSWYTILLLASYCFWDRISSRARLLYLLDNLKVALIPYIPFRYISRVWGKMCDVSISLEYRPYIYQLYIKVFHVNMEEAIITDLTQYRSMGEFFRRQIDPSLRPIDQLAQIVSPVDGRIMHNAVVCNGMVEQIKGVSYSLKAFLGPNLANDSSTPSHKFGRCLMDDPKLHDLYSCVIYLSPGDYHRFHSPASWQMRQRRHFTGDLLSVNPRMVSWFPDLFVQNERVVLSGWWKYGFFSMTAVGATNVGSIVVYKDKALKTNLKDSKVGVYNDHGFENRGVEFLKGDGVGEFKLGSTVVLIFEAPKSYKFSYPAGKQIKYGEKLLVF
ncbi:unnamed protein product [Clavelina lepadiformis]|uniref:phosphatidylserine decarboxylase n=1 Tax=Clavelina lepadiformis TaxID=159417 RepID=A0ABP0FAM8_CLALP